MDAPSAPSAMTVSILLVAALFAGLVAMSHDDGGGDGESLPLSTANPEPSSEPEAPATTLIDSPPEPKLPGIPTTGNFTSPVNAPLSVLLPGVLPPRPRADVDDRSGSLPADWHEPVRSFSPACWAEGLRSGLFGGIGDSLAREQSSQLHRLVFGRRWNWQAKCAGRTSPKACLRRTVGMRYVGIPDSARATPGGGTMVQWNARQADALGVSQLLDAAPVNASANVTLMVSRGLWDAMNLGAPPSQSFADVKAIAEVFAKRGGGEPGTVRRVVVYVPHCAHAHKADHRATCGGQAHLGMYQRAVACAAAQSLRGLPGGGGGASGETGTADDGRGDVRLAVYDSCSVIAQDDPRGMHDSWHLSDRMRNRTLSMMLGRFVCPNSARARGIDLRSSSDSGWYVDVPLVGGGAEGHRLRVEAMRDIEARWDCRVFEPATGGAPATGSSSSENAATGRPAASVVATTAPTHGAASNDTSGWGWPQCPWARPARRTALDAALGFEFRNECACTRGDFTRVADGCWPSIMAGHVGAHKMRANYAHDQLCRLNNTPPSAHRCSAAGHLSTLPHHLARNAGAVHEMGVVGCIAADAPQVLCLLNLGATVFPGVDPASVFDRFRDEAGMSDDDARAVCRCHLGTADTNVSRTAWCRSLRVVEERVTSVFNRSLQIMASETVRSHAPPLSGHALRWNVALNATRLSGAQFGCDAASVMFLPMCPRLWELHDMRKPQPSHHAVVGWLRDGALNAHSVDLPLLSGKVPAYARW